MVTIAAAAGRRRPPVRPPQGGVLLQRLRGPADHRRRRSAILWAAVRPLHRSRSRCSRSGWAWRCRSLSSAAQRRCWPGRCCAARAQHRSMALEADARHLFTDVWTSAGVVVGAGAACSSPAGCGSTRSSRSAVALNIVREGVPLVWRSVDGLMDQALEPEVQAEIERTLSALRRSRDPLRPRRHAARRAAPLRRPAHAHAGELDAGARRGAARVGRAGADERGAGPARHDPAAADGRRGALQAVEDDPM